MNHTIYFVVPAIPETLRRFLKSDQSLPSPEALAPDAPPWRGAQWSWIIQTFLYMKQAGLAVELVDKPVANAICVVHFATTKNKVWAPNSFVVGVRADNAPMRMREIEIVQSPANLGKPDVYLMHHWPQPRLIPRDASRGNRIERISYFGGAGGISPKFSDSSFKASLDAMHISLNLCFDTTQWHNYCDTDLVLAVRNHHHPLLINTKPASKLVNTWKAGCVGLLGKEPAFRAIGRVNEDYFEVNTPEDVLEVMRLLKQNPHHYEHVRQAGMQRYLEFSFEAIQKHWIDLFNGPITAAFTQWQKEKEIHKLLRYPRRYWQAIRQWSDHRLFNIPVRSREMIEILENKLSLRHH
jgi:hypothetical protein